MKKKVSSRITTETPTSYLIGLSEEDIIAKLIDLHVYEEDIIAKLIDVHVYEEDIIAKLIELN